MRRQEPAQYPSKTLPAAEAKRQSRPVSAEIVGATSRQLRSNRPDIQYELVDVQRRQSVIKTTANLVSTLSSSAVVSTSAGALSRILSPPVVTYTSPLGRHLKQHSSLSFLPLDLPVFDSPISDESLSPVDSKTIVKSTLAAPLSPPTSVVTASDVILKTTVLTVSTTATSTMAVAAAPAQAPEPINVSPIPFRGTSGESAMDWIKAF